MGKTNQNAESGLPREAALFEAAIRLTGSDRVSFLDRACGSDAALRQRLESLLAAHEQLEGVLAEPVPVAKRTMKLELADGPDETVGQKIGRYKILEKVGEGGCGVVYVAEQTEPVRRRVALKVIKLGMDTKQVVARFEAERQALAMMDHPNIAKVLDAGTTETGRPYFIMELVRGIRITDYCDQNKLSTKERLDLFIKICQAIQHAHQKGIIHRDIKPSNILVTLHDGVPVPKVIDFGIAKATEGKLTDATVYTQLHQFIGTPAYMSPEQAEMSGLDIDTRSDIYSLGVLLYELLTGKTPFDAQELMSQGIDAMRKTIREQDPLRPSTKLATLKGEELTTTAERRSIETSKLAKLLRGDLDWIVMKCLEKDRTRRYETANGLAVDIKRHLNNEPVAARPPSKLYEFQKTVRRHKFGFAATAAIILVLALGIIMTAWQSVLATRAKKEAVMNAQRAVAARASETKLRQQAQAEELAARQRAYASDMNVAAEALAGNNLGRALDLLNRQRPAPGQKDLRGWEWRYLWGQTRSDASFTLCRESEIISLAVSPDGNLLAIGTRHRGGLSVWDLRTRQESFHLVKDEINVRTAFSPTEPLLAFTGLATSGSGKEQSTLHLWNAATHQTLAELPLDSVCVGLAFSRDGQTLATCTLDDRGGHITLWHMPDGSKLASYPTQPLYAPEIGNHFATTPDLRLAAYAYGSSPNLRVGVVDLQTGRELWNAVPSKEYVMALAFSPDGKTLASGNGFSDTEIRFWDVATGRETGHLEGHGSWISSLVFWPDGKKLASCSADQTLRLWDIGGGNCLDVLRGNRQEVWSLALLPDAKTLVSGAKDGTVRFWDTSATHPHQPCITIPANLVIWSFADNSQSALTLNSQGRVTRWSEPDFQREETALMVLTNVQGSIFSPDGRFLAVSDTNGILQAWDVSRRVLVRQITNAPGYIYPWKFFAEGTKLVAWSSSDNLNHEWNLTTGLEIQSWPGLSGLHNSAPDVSPDGRFSLELGYEGEALLRNLAEESQTNLDLNFLEGEWASYSPDGKLFAVGSDLGIAGVWETATWKPVATLGGFLHGVHNIVFSPDTRRLAVTSDGKEAVRLYDTESWQNVFNLEAVGTGFNGVGFSPDGNDIGWANAKGDLYLWHAPSWDEIHAAEAKDLPSPGYGVTGKIETPQP